MSSSSVYKRTFTLQERQDELQTLLSTKPTNIPIICEKCPIGRSTLSSMSLKTFTLPPYVTVASLLRMIRLRLKLSSEEALFVFVDGLLPPLSAELGSLFSEHKDEEDGWLYVTYAGENTFGR